MPKALRSVIPSVVAISRSRTPGSSAMQTRTRAWLLRKLHSAMRPRILPAATAWHLVHAHRLRLTTGGVQVSPRVVGAIDLRPRVVGSRAHEPGAIPGGTPGGN